MRGRRLSTKLQSRISSLFSDCSTNGIERSVVMQKLCSNCDQSAQFSFNALISSLGGKRVQKTSRVVLFCSECLREFIDHLCSDALSESVSDVYTHLEGRLRERSI